MINSQRVFHVETVETIEELVGKIGNTQVIAGNVSAIEGNFYVLRNWHGEILGACKVTDGQIVTHSFALSGKMPRSE